MADLTDKEREKQLTEQIQKARDDLRSVKKLNLPKGVRGAWRHLRHRLSAYIAEKVKNRKKVRQRIHAGSKPTSGPDVSQYQGSVDWKAVRTAHDFAFTKATEGRTYTDPTFSSARLTAMHDAGLRVGAYHFARPDLNAAADEARNFVGTVKSRGGNFIGYGAWLDGKAGVLGALDFEHTPYSASWAKAWAEQFKSLTGVDPIAYGGGYSLNPIVSVLGNFGAVWLAAYVSTFEDAKGYFAGNDAQIKLWQFTSSGSVPGVSGNCDVNRYVG